MTVRAALYARVSTDDQDCSMQIDALRSYAVARNWSIAREYRESASGATIKKRPEFRAMMERALARELDAVLVWKLDRFGRSLPDCISSLEQLESAGVLFIATSQGLSTEENNPASRFMLQILAAAAEFERSLIRERTKLGVERARAQGKQIGRPRRVFDREKMRRLLKAGHSARKVAKILGVGEGTIRRAMR